MTKAELQGLKKMADHFMETEPEGPLGNILKACVDEIIKQRRRVSRIKKACEDVPETLLQSADIIADELGDVDGEAPGVRRMAKRLRKVLGPRKLWKEKCGVCGEDMQAIQDKPGSYHIPGAKLCDRADPAGCFKSYHEACFDKHACPVHPEPPKETA